MRQNDKGIPETINKNEHFMENMIIKILDKYISWYLIFNMTLIELEKSIW